MTDKMIKQDHIVDDGEVIASYRTHPDIVRDGKRVMGLLLGFPAQHRVEHIFTETSVAAIRDALTTWLDAPRLAARDQLCGVEAIACCYSTGLALIKSKAGEWGVVDTDWLSMASHIGLESTGAQRDWYTTEGEARRAFADDTGKVICESCARFIDHDAATVDGEGIYTCADVSTCGAGITTEATP